MGNAAAIGRAIREKMSATLRDAMTVAAESVTLATPVDTGHAASNWILSTGSPYAGIAGSRENVSTAEQDAGISRLQTYDVGREGKIFLRNNVFYLQFLDRGWSPQAEAGFVARALATGASVAPHGSKGAVRKLLGGMARAAYHRGV